MSWRVFVIVICASGMAAYLCFYGKITNYNILPKHAVKQDPLRRLKQGGVLTPILEYGNNILLYSAVVGNSSKQTSWDTIAVQGWFSLKLANERFHLCVKHKSGKIRLFSNGSMHGPKMKVPMFAKQYKCHLDRSYVEDLPEFVSVTTGTNKPVCPRDITSYVTTVFARNHPGEIAIFAKVVFGNVPAVDFLSWFEIHKLFGFDKAYLYPSGLNDNAMKVLRHYEEEGMAEINAYDVPGPRYGKPLVPLGTKSPVGWNDKNVALLDGLERLRGYDYIVAFDIDEYIIPKQHDTWRSLFDYSFSLHPKAAGSTFSTYLHLKNWGPVYNVSTFDIARYLNRTGPTRDRVKHVSKPKRLRAGGLMTHMFGPKHGYNRFRMPVELAALHHFRSCRPTWFRNETKIACNTSIKFYDDTIYNLYTKVEPRLLQLKRKLGV